MLVLLGSLVESRAASRSCWQVSRYQSAVRDHTVRRDDRAW